VTPDADLDVARLTPSPPVTAPAAAEAIRACFALSGELTRLPGEADDNFLLDTGDHQRYVVKFAHLRADPAVVGVQVRVLKHIASADGELPVPRVLPAVDGGLWTTVPDGPLRGRVVHALTYLDGRLLLTAAELSLLPDLILGRIVARIIISEWRAERFPDNRAYVLRNTPRAWEHLHRLLSIPGEQTAARIQEATRA
jgi:hydroxylysine kinase